MIKRLQDSISEKKAPIVVGLDPTLKLIPERVKQKAFLKKGETLEGAAQIIHSGKSFPSEEVLKVKAS